MQYRQKLLHLPARLGLLAGLVVALLLAFGGQPFSLGRSKPIATVGGQGYWLLAKDGGLFAYGDATYLGNNLNSNADIIGIARTPTLRGYWAADDDGTVFPFGDAQDYGSRISTVDDIRGFAARPQGDGYWLVTRDGLVIPKGAAAHLGNTPPGNVNQKIVGMEATPSGNGYWIVGRDGGIFAFGDAPFYGSTGAIVLNKPIASMSRTESGLGYRFVANDGGVFNYGDALFYGSTGANPPASTIVDLAATASGSGYWLVAGNGKVYPFGDANSYGDASNLTLQQPMVGIAATPIVRVNSTPAATNDSATLGEDGSTTVDVLGSDSGLGDGPVSVAITRAPSHGTASVGSDQRITYTPATNYSGSDSLTYKVTDADGESSSATLSFTVNSGNHAPIASNLDLSTNEDNAKSGTAPAGDADGDDLSYERVAGPSHGTLNLNTGSGAFTYTPAVNYHGPDSFTFRANDGRANSNVGRVSITVNPVNDAPVAAAGVLTTSEDTPRSGTATVSDVDGDALTYSVMADPTHGTLTAFNTASGAYTYAPAANYFGGDSFTFRANDGTGNSNTATVTITVNAVNDVPVAVPGVLTTDEDAAGSSTVVASDVESLALTFSVVTPPAHGILTGFDTATGAYTYTPATDANGADSFTFTANDGTADSNVAAVTITVNPLNDAPIAAAGVLTTNEDTPGSGTAAASDVDGDALTYSVMAAPTHGVLTTFNTATGAYTYTPAANYFGSDSFTFKATDGTVDSNVATVTITVTSVNDSPGASAGVLITNEDTAGSSTVVAADTESLVLAYSVVTPPAHGGLTAFNTATGAYTYLPDANHHGGDSFTFRANDGTVDSNVATVTITVTSVNDIPVAVVDNVITDEDTALDIPVLANDDGLGDGIPQVVLLNQDVNGTASVNPDGSVHFAPNANWNGDATFDYRVTDADAESSAASVHVHVNAVNDAPVAVAGVLTTLEDTAGAGNVSAADTELGVLSYSIVAGPTHGTLPAFNAATGAYTYTPAANYHGGDSFTFKANDGTSDSNVATVTITVTSVNDAPVAANGALTTNEDTAGSSSVVATDIDGDARTYSVVTGPTNGTLTAFIAATGAYTYTPRANYHGGDSFTFRANDGTVDSNVATVTITVTSVNDAPVAAAGALTTNEDTAGSSTVAASDTEGDLLTYSVVSSPGHGALTLNTASGAYTYTPTPGYHGGDSFTFKANDGGSDSNVATVAITVTSVNDAPVAVPGVLVTNENTAGSGTVLVTDADGDTLTYSIETPPTHGVLTIFDTGSGSYTYMPTATYNGGDSFTFKAHDGTVDSNVASVTITVNPANDAPVAADGLLFTSEDTAVSSGVGANDIDGDPLTYSIVAGPAHGTLPVFNASTGDYTYLPAANYNGGDSFTFKANDGIADSNVATVSISVLAVNDKPVAANGVLATNEDTAGSGTLVASDVEDDNLIYSVVSAPSHGTVSDLNAFTGAYTYTPATGYHGGDSFTFKATAGLFVDSNVATITITVNDAPVAAPGALTTNEDTAGSSTVVATDTEGDARTYSVVTNPAHGILTSFDAVTGAYTYMPAANYHGGDSFTFKASAAGADSNVAAVTITVSAVNDAPVAAPGVLTTNEDTAGSSTVVGTDIDSDTGTYSVVANPTHGTVTAFIAATGAYTYTPMANYHGADSFTFSANDGTSDSNVATVTITVTSINDAPVADNFTVRPTAPGAPATFSLMAHVHDVDGDALTVALTSSTSSGGSITCNASGTCTYTPPPVLFLGFDTFTYSVTDPSGLSDPGTVTIDYR